MLTSCLDGIVETRNSSVRAIVHGLETLREDYLEGRKGCNFACRAMHLGVLSITMRQLNIEDYFAKMVITIVGLVNGLKDIQSPRWSDTSEYYFKPHSCPNEGSRIEPRAFDLSDGMDDMERFYNSGEQGTLNEFAAQLVQSVKPSLVGLELSDFVEVHPKDGMLF